MQKPMQNPINTSPSNPLKMDAPFYISEDGLVEIRIKSQTAKRYPQHNYPIVCLLLRPLAHSRVQKRSDGQEGLDVLLTHEELRMLNDAVAKADPHYDSMLAGKTKKKDPARKEKWDRINAWRHRRTYQ